MCRLLPSMLLCAAFPRRQLVFDRRAFYLAATLNYERPDFGSACAPNSHLPKRTSVMTTADASKYRCPISPGCRFRVVVVGPFLVYASSVEFAWSQSRQGLPSIFLAADHLRGREKQALPNRLRRTR